MILAPPSEWATFALEPIGRHPLMLPCDIARNEPPSPVTTPRSGFPQLDEHP